MAATLLDFALTCDDLAATRSRIAKETRFADYLRPLGDIDLPLAVRYAAGYPTGLRGVRVLNAGWSLVSDVVLYILRLDRRRYHDLVVASGEIGEALCRIWPTRDAADPFALYQLAALLDQLADARSQERKREVLTELYSRCAHPREAAYLSKILCREMRTGMQQGVLLGAISRAFGRELPAIRACHLLVGDLGELALLARHDRLACATLRLFGPVQFMLATPQESSSDAAATMAGRTFLAEDKLDGIRAQVHKRASEVAIFTRTMERADESFPDVVDAVRALPGEFLLDGEIVPYRDGVVLPFTHIQQRRGRKGLTPRALRENPLRFVAFDIVYRDGGSLLSSPLRERRQHLETLLANQDHVLITRPVEVSTAAEVEAAFEKSRSARNEGLVLKDPDSAYTPGRRGRAWLKLKTHLPTLDCVVTAAEVGHGKRRKSLSDYTFAVWDRNPADPAAQLVNIGKAYSGVTDEEIVQLTDLFTQLTTRQLGRLRVVRPQVVLEIAFDQVQRSTRHASGFALRFPRIKRIRWDKSPEDADGIDRVIEIYNDPRNTARPDKEPDPPPPEPTLFD